MNFYMYRDGQEAYPSLVDHVLHYGVTRESRGRLARDLGYTTIVLDSPLAALPLGQGRRLSKQIAALETLQLIGAESRPDLLMEHAPQFAAYSVDGKGRHFHGAYGERIGQQLEQATTKLLMDKGTRQAVITLWNPTLDNQMGHADYPCTVTLGFAVQQDRKKLHDTLEMYTTMRSNDVWLGLPYDLFQFTQLQLTVADTIGVKPGRYFHNTWSLHLYEDDADKAIRYLDRRMNMNNPIDEPQPRGLYNNEGPHIEGPIKSARMIMNNRYETVTQKWYHDALWGTDKDKDGS